MLSLITRSQQQHEFRSIRESFSYLLLEEEEEERKMSIVCLEESIITKFVEDTEAFNKCVDEHFAALDANGDGVLSRSELENRSGRLGFPELELQSREEIAGGYDLIFQRFDADRSGTIDKENFRSVMKELMLAKARGIGTSPLFIVVQKDSLLFKAVQYGLPHQ